MGLRQYIGQQNEQQMFGVAYVGDGFWCSSACLELDQTAQIISYEEYHPFGTTSCRSGLTETEVSLKRYKYVGKERDEETGLYYYGARYYAAWICRFVSVDPLQFDYPQLTPFNYAGNKPVTHIDIDGMQGTGDEPYGTQAEQSGEFYSNGAIVENNKGKWQYKGDGNWLNITNYKEFTWQGKSYHYPIDLTIGVPANLVGYKGYTYNIEDLKMRYKIMHGDSHALKQAILNFEKNGWAEPLTGYNFWKTYGHTLGSLLAMQFYITDGAGMAAGAQGGSSATRPKGYKYTATYSKNKTKSTEVNTERSPSKNTKTQNEVETTSTVKKDGLGNPFKEKTFVQIDEMFNAKGFSSKGPDPVNGKGSYFNPKTETRYYLDKGGMYKKGFEGPHVDVWYNGHPSFEKSKFFLDGSPKMYTPLK